MEKAEGKQREPIVDDPNQSPLGPLSLSVSGGDAKPFS